MRSKYFFLLTYSYYEQYNLFDFVTRLRANVHNWDTQDKEIFYYFGQKTKIISRC